MKNVCETGKFRLVKRFSPCLKSIKTCPLQKTCKSKRFTRCQKMRNQKRHVPIYDCCPDSIRVDRYSSSGGCKKLCQLPMPSGVKGHVSLCQNGGKCQQVNQTSCDCPPGFKGKYCHKDIDECQLSPSPCAQKCKNHFGSYTCSCHNGFTLRNKKDCEKNTPCKSSNCMHFCHEEKEHPKGYYCTCSEGYRISNDGYSCERINPCSINNGECHQICTQIPTNSTLYHENRVCSCVAGFKLARDGITCVIKNPCKNLACKNGGVCDTTAVTLGHEPKCLCNKGWTGKNCDEDVDECYQSKKLCEYKCRNLPGSYECICPENYSLSEDGRNCFGLQIEKAPCLLKNCEHSCDSVSLVCKCDDGFTLDSDGRSCKDIDECKTDPCQTATVCTNFPGSYTVFILKRFKIL